MGEESDECTTVTEERGKLVRPTLFVGAAFAGLVATWAMRVIALNFGIVNHPNPIVQDHRTPVPYLGGLGVLLGAAFPLLFTHGFRQNWLPVVCGLVGFGLVGLVDDLTPLPPSTKFASQLLVALSVVAITFFSHYPGINWPTGGWMWLGILGPCMWLVAVVNAVNFIDVCDGLAASVAAATLLCWGWFALSELSPIYIAVGGASVGFLWWNKPRARIYLGDCGAQALGFLMGSAALDHFVSQPANWTRFVTPILCTAVPLFELIFITVVRVRKGLSWWKGSPDHFALRLQRAGLSKSMIDLLAAGLSVALWFCGAMLARTSWIPALLLLAVLLTGFGICWRLLLVWEV